MLLHKIERSAHRLRHIFTALIILALVFVDIPLVIHWFKAGGTSGNPGYLQLAIILTAATVGFGFVLALDRELIGQWIQLPSTLVIAPLVIGALVLLGVNKLGNISQQRPEIEPATLYQAYGPPPPVRRPAPNPSPTGWRLTCASAQYRPTPCYPQTVREFGSMTVYFVIEGMPDNNLASQGYAQMDFQMYDYSGREQKYVEGSPDNLQPIANAAHSEFKLRVASSTAKVVVNLVCGAKQPPLCPASQQVAWSGSTIP